MNSKPQNPQRAALRAEDVAFSYYNGLVVRDVSLSLHPGERVAVLGPNGSGKTTLIKLLSGVLTPTCGRVSLGGEDVRQLGRRHTARRLAVVPQTIESPFGFTAREVVMLGRTAHVRPLLGADRHDRAVVERQMSLMQVDELADRPFGELSGGEQQRVVLAMALAQEPEILLLDEPVAHLDISHQIEILELIADLSRKRELTVLAAMHNLNLAALYFERLMLLDRGRVVADGDPDEVLREERIDQVFGAKVQIQPHPTRRTPQVVLLPLLG